MDLLFHQSVMPGSQEPLKDQEVLAQYRQEQSARQQAQQMPPPKPQEGAAKNPHVTTFSDPIVAALNRAESKTLPPLEGGAGVQLGGPVASAGLNDNNGSLNQT